jgi:pyruvate dehydrogenase E2 component (dihydrolipoamide acetyltransferase)
MAKLSPTMETGQMVRWMVKVGDTVKEGDTLAEIQTDKAVMPMEAFDNGVVAHLDVKEGDEIALGQRVLVLAKKGEDPKQVAQQAAKGASAAEEPDRAAVPAAKRATRKEEPKQAAEPARKGSSIAAPKPEPAAAEKAEALATQSNGQESLQTAVEAEPEPTGDRAKASPLARKIAAEAKVDISAIPGSGPGGRVIRRDVESYLESRVTSKAAEPAAPETTDAAKSSAPPAAPRRAVSVTAREPVRIPHTAMRKTIAKRMVESAQSLPVIHVSVDIRLDKVMAIREALNKQLAAEEIKLSVGDFVTKAVALALRKHPNVNASYEPDAMVIHPEVNVGIAVAIEGGLMVPVLHHADVLGLREIRTGTEALAQATRKGTLKSNQMMGSTFTISNLGMYGVKQFDAIINPPEVAILAVGAAEKKPIVVGDALAIGTVTTVTLTADHRAIDGALAAEFLRSVKGLLEEPASMLV